MPRPERSHPTVPFATVDPIEQLYAHAAQDEFVYRHHWRRYDLVIWDNRCTMHAATPLLSNDYRRDMRRATTNESGPEMSAYEWARVAA